MPSPERRLHRHSRTERVVGECSAVKSPERHQPTRDETSRTRGTLKGSIECHVVFVFLWSYHGLMRVRCPFDPVPHNLPMRWSLPAAGAQDEAYIGHYLLSAGAHQSDHGRGLPTALVTTEEIRGRRLNREASLGTGRSSRTRRVAASFSRSNKAWSKQICPSYHLLEFRRFPVSLYAYPWLF